MKSKQGRKRKEIFVGKAGVSFTGKGVTQSYVTAHMWFNLSAKGGDSAAKTQNVAASKMTKAQIAETQKLAAEWKPKKPAKSHAKARYINR